jgi:hypothetical protein
LFGSREAIEEEGANRLQALCSVQPQNACTSDTKAENQTEAMCISPIQKEDEEKLLEPNLEPRVPAHDGFIKLGDDFRHLGAIISSNLRDELEIATRRIKKATVQIGAMRAFFHCPHIQLSTKLCVFIAIPNNTAFWGCNSWAMTDKMQKTLRVFQHKSICSILNMSMHKVKAERIMNKQVRNRFLHAPDIIDVIHCRQVKRIGKIARMDEKRAPRRRLIASWCENPRKTGKPQHTNKNTNRSSYREPLQRSSPACPKTADSRVGSPLQKTNELGTPPLPDGGRQSHTTHSKITHAARPQSIGLRQLLSSATDTTSCCVGPAAAHTSRPPAGHFHPT